MSPPPPPFSPRGLWFEETSIFTSWKSMQVTNILADQFQRRFLRFYCILFYEKDWLLHCGPTLPLEILIWTNWNLLYLRMRQHYVSKCEMSQLTFCFTIYTETRKFPTDAYPINWNTFNIVILLYFRFRLNLTRPLWDTSFKMAFLNVNDTELWTTFQIYNYI